jgi:hypothetical protein
MRWTPLLPPHFARADQLRLKPRDQQLPRRQAGNWLEINVGRGILASSQAEKNKMVVGLGRVGMSVQELTPKTLLEAACHRQQRAKNGRDGTRRLTCSAASGSTCSKDLF